MGILSVLNMLFCVLPLAAATASWSTLPALDTAHPSASQPSHPAPGIVYPPLIESHFAFGSIGCHLVFDAVLRAPNDLNHDVVSAELVSALLRLLNACPHTSMLSMNL